MSVRHLISYKQLDPGEVRHLLDRAAKFAAAGRRGAWSDALSGQVVALLFAEPSTRTYLSFESAVKRLGGTTISTPVSSLEKAETLADTLRVVEGYADAIVLRHRDDNTDDLARPLSVPVVNGGDDSREHPTQALLDLFMIEKEMNTLSGLTVGIGFDPRFSRTLKSFCRALASCGNNTVISVAPPELQMDDGEIAHLRDSGLSVVTSNDPGDLLHCPVVYANRIQVERHKKVLDYPSPDWLEVTKSEYSLRASDVEHSEIKVILDPLPRVGELEEKVDELPQAKYFEQAAAGVWIRMAVMEWLLSGE